MYKKLGQVSEHYSPELVKIMIEKFKNSETLKDWSTVKQLAVNIGISKSEVQKIVNENKNSHPDWIRMSKGETALDVIHIHPDLSQLIRDKYKDNELAPKGWIVPTPLKKLIGIHLNTLQKNAKVYRNTHAEWFKNYKDHNGKIREHYSPELVEILKTKFQKNENNKSV